MGEPTHQLVVQFPEDAFPDFDALNAAVAEIRDGTGTWLDRPDARAAARLVDGEDYELLWPKGDTKPFKVI